LLVFVNIRQQTEPETNDGGQRKAKLKMQNEEAKLTESGHSRRALNCFEHISNLLL